MRYSHRGGVALVALGLLVSGCYGPFNLTRRLYQWNSQVGDKWEKELVFLLLVALPVYELTALGDAIVFNSMEFWTGRNPVEPPMMKNSAAAVVAPTVTAPSRTRMNPMASTAVRPPTSARLRRP